MSLSRKHFTALAEIVAIIDTNGGAISSESLAYRLAAYLSTENHNFDRQRFLRAALPVSYDERTTT